MDYELYSPCSIEKCDKILRQVILHATVDRLNLQINDRYKDPKGQEQIAHDDEYHLGVPEGPYETFLVHLLRFRRHRRTKCEGRNDQKAHDHESRDAHSPLIPNLLNQSTKHDWKYDTAHARSR